ncbi:MAG: hypothetical protein AAB036_01150 [Elusimicrobiota bacterium]
MKKTLSANGRKHGLRSRSGVDHRLKTTLTFETLAQAYHWTTNRGRSRLVIKH